MRPEASWDWEPGKRVVLPDATACESEYEWMEEPQASPDGESLAAVVKLGDGEFSLSVNGRVWENVFEKAWYPRFSPDGRLTALVQADMAWTVAVDGEPWEEAFDFCWNTTFSRDGSVIAAAAQRDGRYGMVLDGEPWETLFENANNFTLSADGSASAAAVQVKSLAQADIAAFQSGIFSVAVGGQVWDSIFVNCFKPALDASGRAACGARLSLYDYAVVVDGKAWAKTYACAWNPIFNPATGDVIAPVKDKGAWGLAKNGESLWEPRFLQCWRPAFSEDGKVLAAIAAPEFGRFTVAVNDLPWEERLSAVTDLAVGPTGRMIAAQGSENNAAFRILVNGRLWPGVYDMAFGPAVSPAENHAAVRVEKAGKQYVVVDGVAYGQAFDRAFDPIFSPEGDKVLIRGLADGQFLRIVAAASEFAG